MNHRLNFILMTVILGSLLACSHSSVNESHTSTLSPPIENHTKESKTTIRFEQELHDFGVVQEGDLLEHVFKFQNTGEEPLIIFSVKGAGGNMASSFTKEPIPVGGVGQVKVKYMTKGRFGKRKTAWTVYANTHSNPIRLFVEMEIVKPITKKSKQ